METTVERHTVIEAAPDEVWEALTDDERLGEWLGDDVELDPVEGGDLTVREGGRERSGTVETVIERERLEFTWAEPGGDPTRVEFEIAPADGGTRVTVTETRASADWASRLRALSRASALAFA